MIIDRLQDAWPHLQHLPPDMQEEIANYIQDVEQEALARGRITVVPGMEVDEEPWEDPVGSLSDLPDDMFEELDKIRHSNPPSPPFKLP